MTGSASTAEVRAAHTQGAVAVVMIDEGGGAIADRVAISGEVIARTAVRGMTEEGIQGRDAQDQGLIRSKVFFPHP